jgi:hypothetical protein
MNNFLNNLSNSPTAAAQNVRDIWDGKASNVAYASTFSPHTQLSHFSTFKDEDRRKAERVVKVDEFVSTSNQGIGAVRQVEKDNEVGFFKLNSANFIQNHLDSADLKGKKMIKLNSKNLVNAFDGNGGPNQTITTLTDLYPDYLKQGVRDDFTGTMAIFGSKGIERRGTPFAATVAYPKTYRAKTNFASNLSQTGFFGNRTTTGKQDMDIVNFPLFYYTEVEEVYYVQQKQYELMGINYMSNATENALINFEQGYAELICVGSPSHNIKGLFNYTSTPDVTVINDTSTITKPLHDHGPTELGVAIANGFQRFENMTNYVSYGGKRMKPDFLAVPYGERASLVSDYYNGQYGFEPKLRIIERQAAAYGVENFKIIELPFGTSEYMGANTTRYVLGSSESGLLKLFQPQSYTETVTLGFDAQTQYVTRFAQFSGFCPLASAFMYFTF